MNTDRAFPSTRALAATLLAAVLASAEAAAATFTVNSTADEADADTLDGICASAQGTCTLRAAVMQANNLAGEDTVNLPAGTYALTLVGYNENAAATGDLDITENLLVEGAGADSTIIDGNGTPPAANSDRVIEVHASASAAFKNLTLQNGAPSSSGGVNNQGGGMYNDGSTTLENVRLLKNVGSIAGGIYNAENKVLKLAKVTLDGNQALGGGAITNEGSLEADSVTLSNNVAGGIGYYAGGGGGLWNRRSATLKNATISNNKAQGYGGGGIFNAGNLTLTNVTLADNTATFIGGGGIYNEGAIAAATATLVNTLLAANLVNGSPGNCAGKSLVSNGHNLSSDNTCGLSGTDDKSNLDAALDSLADNGGFTQTRALLAGSPAIDAGDDLSAPVQDQRGTARPQDGDGDGAAISDIGAYEFAKAANQAPSADAGSDLAIKLGQTAALAGSGVDPDHGPSALVYAWQQTDGPESVALNGAATAAPSFTPRLPGAYVFRLVANDGAVDSAPDLVNVAVEDVPVLLLRPKGGEVWVIKTAQEISWYRSATLGSVPANKKLSVQFSKNGRKWTTLKTPSPNSSAWTWKPKAAHASESALVRICLPAAKKKIGVCDASDQAFAIRK